MQQVFLYVEKLPIDLPVTAAPQPVGPIVGGVVGGLVVLLLVLVVCIAGFGYKHWRRRMRYRL